MPDVVITSDPFAKPSLKKEIASIYYTERPFKISLPQLGEKYNYKAINKGNEREGQALDGSFTLYPGVYLLSSEGVPLAASAIEEVWRDFVAPPASGKNSYVSVSPAKYINPDEDLVIEAEIIGSEVPSSVMIYPDYVSFWNDHNILIPMERTGGNTFRGVVPKDYLGWDTSFNYNIVVTEKDGTKYTWPQNVEGDPLDWDFTSYDYYSSEKLRKNDAIVLLTPEDRDSNLAVFMLPEAWNFRFFPELKSPVGSDAYVLTSKPDNDGKIIVNRYVGDELEKAPFLDSKNNMVVKISPTTAMEGVTIGLTGKNGTTYSAPLLAEYQREPSTKLHKEEATEYVVPLRAFQQSATHIVPSVYPSFLPREITMEPMPFSMEEIENVELMVPANKGEEVSIRLEGIWLE